MRPVNAGVRCLTETPRYGYPYSIEMLRAYPCRSERHWESIDFTSFFEKITATGIGSKVNLPSTILFYGRCLVSVNFPALEPRIGTWCGAFFLLILTLPHQTGPSGKLKFVERKASTAYTSYERASSSHASNRAKGFARSCRGRCRSYAPTCIQTA